jgi:hypothetical protein
MTRTRQCIRAREICDGVDNNCNGVVDEGVWAAGPIVSISDEDGGGNYPRNIGAPGIARFQDGTFAVVAASVNGTAAGDGNIDAWRRASDLSPMAGPVAILTSNHSDTYFGKSAGWPHAYVDGSGTKLVVTATLAMDPQDTHAATIAVTDSSLSTPTVTVAGTGYYSGSCCHLPAEIYASAPILAWTGTDFAMTWTDSHLSGSYNPSNTYVATMSLSGLVTGTHYATTTADGSGTYYSGANARSVLAVGSSRAVVAWHWGTGTGNTGRTRYVIMDSELTSGFGVPFDLPAGANSENDYPSSAAHVGSSFLLATYHPSSATIQVHRLDDQTGTELGAVEVDSPAGPNGAGDYLGRDPQLLAFHRGTSDGVLMTIVRNTSIGFAYAPENLGGGFVVTDILVSSASGASLTQIDSKHVAMVWADGAVKGTILTCRD